MAPSFSSVQTPDTAPSKKAKTSTERIAKKRKREDGQEDAQVSTEPSVKKIKKQKSEEAVGATTVAAQNGAPSAESVPPKIKSERVPDEEPRTDDKAVHRSEKKSGNKNKNKKHRRQEETGDPEAAAEADNTPAKQKKRKMDHEPTIDGDPSTAPAVVAGPSSLQQTTQPMTQASRETSSAVPEVEKLQSHSPFVQQSTTFYLALSPCANDFPLEGLVAEHISPLLLTYYPPLHAVVLKYSNARLSETSDGRSDDKGVVLSKAVDEYAVTFVYLTVDLVLFKPTKGTWLEGYVNLQNESLLGLVCYNYFSAAIERQRLPKDWRWVEDGMRSIAKTGKEGQGYWVDGSGERVDGRVVFRVRDFDAAPGSESATGSINILGTLLPAGEDRALDEEERRQ